MRRIIGRNVANEQGALNSKFDLVSAVQRVSRPAKFMRDSGENLLTTERY